MNVCLRLKMFKILVINIIVTIIYFSNDNAITILNMEALSHIDGSYSNK